jgi:hypothetical protein
MNEENEKMTAEQKYEAFKKWKADFYEKQIKLTAEIRAKDKTKKT